MGNYFSGGAPVNGQFLQMPPAAAGPGGNGQWNFVSHGSSSFSDGKNQYTGSQTYSNLNVSVIE